MTEVSPEKFDKLSSCVAEMKTEIALLNQKLDTMTKAMEKKQTTMDWILRAAFVPVIASAVAFITSGGLSK